MKKILAILTNVDRYPNSNIKTGLWLGELTHLYHLAKQENWEVIMVSPKGGNVPWDPESLKSYLMDNTSRNYLRDKSFLEKMATAKSFNQVQDELFDAVYLAGGHGTMFDFPDNESLQKIILNHYDNGKLVSAVCHGVCGLLNVKYSDGRYLISDKKITGFTWTEEFLAMRKKVVPFNLEKEIKKRNGNYQKALIPMTSKVCVDRHLITGENPLSSKEIANKIVETLKNNISN